MWKAQQRPQSRFSPRGHLLRERSLSHLWMGVSVSVNWLYTFFRRMEMIYILRAKRVPVQKHQRHMAASPWSGGCWGLLAGSSPSFIFFLHCLYMKTAHGRWFCKYDSRGTAAEKNHGWSPRMAWWLRPAFWKDWLPIYIVATMWETHSGFKTSESQGAGLGKARVDAGSWHSQGNTWAPAVSKTPPGILSTSIKNTPIKTNKALYLSMLHLAKKKKKYFF